VRFHLPKLAREGFDRRALVRTCPGWCRVDDNEVCRLADNSSYRSVSLPVRVEFSLERHKSTFAGIVARFSEVLGLPFLKSRSLSPST